MGMMELKHPTWTDGSFTLCDHQYATPDDWPYARLAASTYGDEAADWVVSSDVDAAVAAAAASSSVSNRRVTGVVHLSPLFALSLSRFFLKFISLIFIK